MMNENTLKKYDETADDIKDVVEKALDLRDKIKYLRFEALRTNEEFYNKGIEDAWNLARKIDGMTCKEVVDCFGVDPMDVVSITREFTYDEVLRMMGIYDMRNAEERFKSCDIEVGDEIMCGYKKGIVIGVDNDTNTFHILWGKDTTNMGAYWTRDFLKKTGKHYENIKSVIDKLSESEFMEDEVNDESNCR